MKLQQAVLSKDEITGLFDGASLLLLLQEKMHLAEGAGEKTGLILLDLDDFKILEQMEKAEADSLLAETVNRLKSCVRSGDILTRIEGSEFAVIPDEIDNSNVTGLIARKIINVLSRPYLFQGNEIILTCSIGIAWSVYGETSDMLLAYARQAMIAAKAEGGNRFHYFMEILHASTSAGFTGGDM